MFATIVEIALKLWNRGIDIGVGVITSTISAGLVAVIAIIFWNWKKKRDLRFEADKQRQQHQITEELDLATTRRATRERTEGLRKDVEIFAARAETVANAYQLADCWEQYFKWLLENKLNLFPGNLRITTEHPAQRRPSSIFTSWC